MAIDVTILTVEPTDDTLDITVNVSTTTLDVIDYEININDTGTGGTVTRSGTLDGKGGNRMGDEVIHEVSFGLNPPEEGRVTAQITSPEEYVGVQDQQSWEKAEGSLAINECNSQPTTSGDLEVTYTLTPSIGAEQTEREVTIRVDGQQVGSATHTIPGRSITRTQTIPADDLPTGSEMPVEIGVGGDFSDCGTVTVGGAADGSVTITECDAAATGPAVTATATLAGTAPAGEVVVSITSEQEGFGGSETVEVPTALDGTQIEATISPDWNSGQHAVEMEAAVIDSGGEVVGTDTTACGSVTLEAAPERPDIDCAPVVEQYGALMAEYGTPGQQFGREGVSNAIAAWRGDEITTDELRGLLDAWRGRCEAPGRNYNGLLLGALGVGALGVGYAVSRRQ